MRAEMKIKHEFSLCGYRKWGVVVGKAFQAEGIASAKCPKQSILGMLEEMIGGQCDWSEVNE